MLGAKRTENVCKECGYAWISHNRNLTEECPNCGNRNFGLASIGCALLLVIALIVGLVIPRCSVHSKRSSTATTGASSPLPRATPRATPERHFATVAEAQREALRRYPELGVAGSRFNTEFLSRYKQYEQQRPDLLQ